MAGLSRADIGFGVERMAMILNEVDDIRKLVYGYSYEDLKFIKSVR